jgi:hypothetical protein
MPDGVAGSSKAPSPIPMITDRTDQQGTEQKAKPPDPSFKREQPPPDAHPAPPPAPVLEPVLSTKFAGERRLLLGEDQHVPLALQWQVGNS